MGGASDGGCQSNGKKYVSAFAEGTFFWLVINAWIWQTLLFGTYGKTYVTDRQPGAGLWYSFVGCISGLIGFLAIVGFVGIWWKPFSFAVLFTPKTLEEVHMAIEGWEASNFYALTVILVQIPFASTFQKWPFAGNIKAPWDGFGIFMTAHCCRSSCLDCSHHPEFHEAFHR